MNLTAESESMAEWLDKVKEEDREALNNYKAEKGRVKASENFPLWLANLTQEEREEMDKFIEEHSPTSYPKELTEVELTQNDLNYSYSSGWNAGLEHSINIINEYLRLNLIDPKMHDEVISKLEALKLSN